MTDVPRILAVGKFVPRKNHLRFVEALCDLADDGPLGATIVGEAASPSQQQLFETVVHAVDDAGLGGVVAIRSNVAHEEMPELYAQHTVFVLPAIAEPGAVSPLEAMGHGLPVVVTDTCGTKGYVREGLDGFVCASDSTPALADAIRKAVALTGQPGARERIAVGAAARFSGAAFLSAFTSMIEHSFRIPFTAATARVGPGVVRP